MQASAAACTQRYCTQRANERQTPKPKQQKKVTRPGCCHPTTIMSERKRIARIFKMRGLSIQSSALDALLNVLRREKTAAASSSSSSSSRRDADNETLLAIIDEIKDRLVQQDGRGGAGNVVTTALLADVVAELSRDAKDVTDEAAQLLDAFRTPRLEFDAMRKQFRLVPFGAEKRSLYGEAVDKVRGAARLRLLACRLFLAVAGTADGDVLSLCRYCRWACSASATRSSNRGYSVRTFSSPSS